MATGTSCLRITLLCWGSGCAVRKYRIQKRGSSCLKSPRHLRRCRQQPPRLAFRLSLVLSHHQLRPRPAPAAVAELVVRSTVLHTFDERKRDQRLSSASTRDHQMRSEEHTSELQSRGHLVSRLLLEKKNDSCWF